MKFRILFAALWLPAVLAHAQSSAQDVQLADQYITNGEYDKAVVLYEKLLDKHPGNVAFYNDYLTCLTELKRYRDAEKVIRRQEKKFPDDISLYVDYGVVQKKEGNEKAARESFDAAINKITPNMPQITKLANRFYSVGMSDQAIRTYEQGRKVFNAENSDLFLTNLVMLYQKTGDQQKVVSTLLDMLELNPGQKQYVQNQLQPLLLNADYSKIVQAELYRRIQKHSDNENLADMLVWFFVQKKDFASAFLQVKALDKRNHEDGNRIFRFAQSALDEGEDVVALEAYRYLITAKGKSSYLYLPSRTMELTAEKNKLVIQHNYSQEDMKQLESRYESYLDEFGKTPQTLPIMRDYASLEIKYLHDPEKAIDMLQQALAINTTDNKLHGNIKLDLGDAQLVNGDVWDAMLLYGQVDKAFHDDALGEEARYKNARLSFYMGNFDWSQTQLDVLKSATSELVANDALALSVFITDNMGLDTTPVPMEMYARADLLIFQNRYDEAIHTLDSITRIFPNHSLSDDVLFEKGRIFLDEQKYTDAAAMFDQIDSSYSFDLLGDDAMFQLADLEQHYLNNKDKAMELYKEILTRYKGSIFTVEARKRYRELRGDEVE